MALYHINNKGIDRIEALLAGGDAGAALMVIARDLRDAEGGLRRALLELQARAYAELACVSMELAYGEAEAATSERARRLLSDGLGVFRGDDAAEASSAVPEIPQGGRTPNELERMKIEQIFQALEATDYVQSAAAEALGISKFQMHRELRKFGLSDEVRKRRAARAD